MTLDQLSVQLLIALSGLLGVQPTPSADPSWHIEQNWTESEGQNYFQASSTDIVEDCKTRPDDKVEMPMVIHGAHTIMLDEKVFAHFGDPSFSSVETFYGVPEIKCRELIAGHKLTWRVDSYTKYFARFHHYPRIASGSFVHNLFSESVHLIGAGCALLLAIFTVTMFHGKVANRLLGSLAFACFGVSIYFAGCVSGLLSIPWSMLAAHKMADTWLWLGNSALIYALRLEGLTNKWLSNFFFASVAIAVPIILVGSSGDVIQMGTSVPFAATLLMLGSSAFQAWRESLSLDEGQKLRRLLQALGLSVYIFACLNEVVVVTGIVDSYPKLPIGFMAGIFLFALAVNERINETYRERDYLRENLEAEVERKTNELRRKTEELETAMVSLKSTQAELIQSAKLASLGTLSAGIAHEINNSLNYVNGAMQPLEKLIIKSFPAEERGKVDRLLGVMKEGLNLTLEIIKSLRNYTGLNQAKFNDVDLRSVGHTSLTILRNKTRGKINVELNIPEGMVIFGSIVGVNQVFMNLISNAIDAMPDGGNLALEGEWLTQDGVQLPTDRPTSEAKWVEVRIRDSGQGMSPETKARIFEPFFTTKEVGKGTGLGLHIVRTEIERHQGRLEVDSELGKGTCFRLWFPVGANSTLAREQETAAMQQVDTNKTQRRSAA